MNWKPLAITILGFATLLTLTACRIQTNKGQDGKDKNVKIDTPFGGLHVATDKTAATDVGLPLYPKAQPFQEKGDSNTSADVHMGFGKWQLRVKVVEYSSPDSENDIITFYKKALGRYGDVITCNGDTPVGTPAVTREGLSCKSSNKDSQIDLNKSDDHLTLKAGSPKHQHIVSIRRPENRQTRFTLIALDLPRDMDKTEETN